MAIIIKNDRVQLVAEGGEPVRHEKALRVVEEDGVARALELKCSCGEVTVVELDYTQAPATPPTPPEPPPLPQIDDAPGAFEPEQGTP